MLRKKRTMYPIFTFGFLFLFLLAPAQEQKKEAIRWLSFEQLSDLLQVRPKKVIISFYTKWCVYCRKMEEEVFTDDAVIDRINRDFYAVRFDAESKDSVLFDGQVFVNNESAGGGRGFHQLALLLGSRNHIFTPPVILLLDEHFTVKKRSFEYMDSKRLLKEISSIL